MIKTGKLVWFVPSKSEWSAFGEELGITEENYYDDFGLSDLYWSSSVFYDDRYDETNALFAGFYYGFMGQYSFDTDLNVRLSATF
jgi:hypothetical protein